MITFEDVAKIENLRRQIEQLQIMLKSQAQYSSFGYQTVNDKWVGIPTDTAPLIREVICKHTVVKILKLLDESARLGVDVEPSKQILAKFLEEIKVADEMVSDRVSQSTLPGHALDGMGT